MKVVEVVVGVSAAGALRLLYQIILSGLQNKIGEVCLLPI